MPEKVVKDLKEELSDEEMKERFERDLERFKKNVDQAFSEQSD